MKPVQDPLIDLLGTTTRAAFRFRLAGARPELGLPEMRRLHAHLESMQEPATPIRVGVVHTYTSDLLDPWLRFEAQLQGLSASIHHAPYGFTHQAALADSDLAAFAPDLTLVMLRWEDLHPELIRPLGALSGADRARMAEAATDAAHGLLARLRASVPGQILFTLLPTLETPGLGEFDSHAEASEGAWRAGVKAMLAARLRSGPPATRLLDLDESLLQLGRDRFFDRRLWYSARYPFSPTAAREISRRVMAIGAAAKLPRVKVIAVDADNTLWGGIVGEDGIDGIALGPDYPGNVYVAFQRRLLEFQQRGFVLAICSKNNPDDLMQVLREHPHQVLREEHFAAMRVNWESKTQNLRSLADELNLGLESFVFVDDSDHECLAVRSELPQVEVVRVPARLVDLPACLDRVSRLEVLQLTEEDRSKTRLYAEERRRRDLAAQSTDVESYLASLDMRMRVRFDDEAALARLAQLTQKTNQFNLTTRRYGESDVRRFIDAPDWVVAHFSLADVFGDNGIVGLALLRIGPAVGDAELDTFLMSCRVIGRRAESAFLDAILRHIRERGVQSVHASFLPTAKNKLAEKFLPEHGFRREADGGYRRDLYLTPPADEHVHPIRIEAG
jgi:FkbH-like protein